MLEEYLTYLPSTLRQRVLKFRLSNHRLPTQHSRPLGTPRDERMCTICDGWGRTEMNFIICLAVPLKMSKETVPSMLINIIHIIRMCTNCIALWTWLQNLRMLSLLDLFVVFFSYFDQTNSETQLGKKHSVFCSLVTYSQQLYLRLSACSCLMYKVLS